jgi:protein ImuB
MAADQLAAKSGVGRGQKLSTALGLQPGLAVFEHDLGRELAALDRLANWGGRFTPTVNLSSPAMLLLEIGGCQRLFGGVEPIVAGALSGCEKQGYSVQWSVAPTPLGASWLAMADRSIVVKTQEAMQELLAKLPCSVPAWDVQVQTRLDSFGLRFLGDLRNLPSASLRQRIGSVTVDQLFQAWGELPDIRRAFVFPERFISSIELPARVIHADALIFAGQRLFAALAGWLHCRQLLVQVCTLMLTDDEGGVQQIVLRFAEPAADEARFVRLLREHLSRLVLKSPVEVLSLQADQVMAKAGESAALFDQAVVGEGVQACLERLRARLGEGRVQLLAPRADYRPECATWVSSQLANSATDFANFMPSTVARQRPLCLLPVPELLAERMGAPYWRGQLKFQSQAERLESGWWDEGEDGSAGDVRRDYFVARNPLGQWLWIFRDAEGWFLHGFFA